MKRMNKRGDVTFPMEQVLRLVLAAVCIILLLFLAVGLYGIFITKTKVEQAKSTLDIIIGKMDYMKKENIASVSILVNSPRDYYIYSTDGNQCNSNKYCLCFAPPVFITGNIDYEKRICAKTEYYIQIVNKNEVIKGEDVAIYQSTSAIITKGTAPDSFIATFDSLSTSALVRWWRDLGIIKK